MAICEICGKEFDKSKRRNTSTHNLCSNKCKYVFLGNMNRKHAYSHKTPLYAVWKSLRQRCNNPKDKNYKNYGGRGISVCDEWNNFKSFYDWAYSNGYKQEILSNGKNKWTIDRIDVNGNYEPSNCRWITNKEQTKDMYKKTCPICGKIFEDRSGHFKERVCCSRRCGNLHKSPIWEFNGQKLRVIEWGEKVGMTAHCLLHRVEIGWSIEEALTIPKEGKRKDYEKYKL